MAKKKVNLVKKLIAASTLISEGWTCMMVDDGFDTGYKNLMRAKKIIDACQAAVEKAGMKIKRSNENV